ncbi:MAG: hypothetical protein ABFC57_08320 [Veillonellales bacterium]
MGSQYEDNELLDECEDEGVNQDLSIQEQASEAVINMSQENKFINVDEPIEKSIQQQVQQTSQRPVPADAKQPIVWKISDVTSNGSQQDFNIYNAFIQNNPHQIYTLWRSGY